MKIYSNPYQMNGRKDYSIIPFEEFGRFYNGFFLSAYKTNERIYGQPPKMIYV